MSNDVSFKKLVRVLTDDIGLELRRTRGSHYLFKESRTGLLVNLQAFSDDGVKPYQLAQLERALIDRGLVTRKRWEELLRKARK